METRKRPSIKLTRGPHGLPRAVVHQIQRGRLIDATMDVIAEEGYLDATVRKILERAGISRRTFYEIFTDKQSCFLAAYQEATEDVLGMVQAACREGDSPEHRIENGLRTLLEFMEAEPKVARACVVEVMAAGNGARQQRAQTMEQLTGLAAKALEQRGGDRHETLLRARLLTGGVHEMVYAALAGGKTKGISGLAEDVAASHLAPPEGVRGG
jgi:AcrR family transcriptional regulator